MRRYRVFRLPHYVAKTTLALGLSATTLNAATVHAGKLDQTRSAVHHSSDDNGEDSRRRSAHEDDDAAMVLWCLIPIITPFCLLAMSDDDAETDEKASLKSDPDRFLPYPYAADHHGHLWLEGPFDTPKRESVEVEDDTRWITGAGAGLREPLSLSGVTGRARAKYHYDLDTVHVPGFAFSLDTASRIGFDTEWQLFLEPDDGGFDRLIIGDLNLTFRLFGTPSIEAHLDLGGRLFIDPAPAGGFNGGFRLSIFPRRPLVIVASLDMGNIGHAFFLEGEVTLGVALGHAEIFGGYRGTMIHGRESSVFFQGPVAGVTAWF